MCVRCPHAGGSGGRPTALLGGACPRGARVGLKAPRFRLWRFPHKPRPFTTRYQGDFTQPCIFGTEFTCTGVGFTPALLGPSESGWYRIHPTHFHSPQAQASGTNSILVRIPGYQVLLATQNMIFRIPISRAGAHCDHRECNAS